MSSLFSCAKCCTLFLSFYGFLLRRVLDHFRACAKFSGYRFVQANFIHTGLIQSTVFIDAQNNAPTGLTGLHKFKQTIRRDVSAICVRTCVNLSNLSVHFPVRN